ncbi:MAG: M20/M25/M40 family metallo-hydrolase [Cyanobacteria bacterium P01_A01_bin.123]
MNFVTKLLGCAVLPVATQAVLASVASAASFTYGETAIQEIYYLSTNLAGRSIGTDKEQEAIAYLSGRLGDFGYTPELQEFTFDFGDESLTSANIIAERQGTSGQQIIVGAHYDTAPSSATIDRTNLQGTNDNSSGVGVLLELAERLDPDSRHTVKFILFGAEEIGLIGSEHYVATMTPEEIDNTIVMINMDSLIVGDYLYLNAGPSAADNPSDGQFRDVALDIAADLGIDARTNPGLNPFYPAGTGCCSDLEAFDGVVPVLAAEATNWEIGDLDGYTQTSNPLVPGGATWHDPETDNLAFINTVFPGLIEERSRDYTQIFDTFISQVNAGGVSVPEPASVVGMAIAVGLGGLLTKRKV